MGRRACATIAAILVVLGAASAPSGAASDAGEATLLRQVADERQIFADGLAFPPLGRVGTRCQQTMLICATQWFDVLGEKPPRYVHVFSGAVRRPEGSRERKQGVVAVRVWRWDPWGSLGEAGLISAELHRAPRGVGSLTIADVSGRRVFLVADTGERLVFDLGTRRLGLE